MNLAQTWRSGGCTGMRMSNLEERQKWQLDKLNAQEYWNRKVLVSYAAQKISFAR